MTALDRLRAERPWGGKGRPKWDGQRETFTVTDEATDICLMAHSVHRETDAHYRLWYALMTDLAEEGLVEFAWTWPGVDVKVVTRG